MFLANLIAVPAVAWAFTRSTEQYHRWHGYPHGTRAFLPLGVGIAIGLAALSNWASFVPGYVYGLILWYRARTARSISKDHLGKGVLAAVTVTLAVAVTAWLTRAWLGDVVEADRLSFLYRMVDTILTQLFVMGIETIVFGLLPLYFMDGADLFAWSRKWWTLAFAAGLVAFVEVLVLSQWDGEGPRPDVARMVILFIAFGTGSLAFWAFHRWRAKTRGASSTSPSIESTA